MPIVVEAVSQDKYNAWVQKAKAEMPVPVPAPAAQAPAQGAQTVATAAATAAAAEDPNKKWTPEELKATGEKVYAANCAACHQPTGKGMPPAFPPLEGNKVANGPKGPHIDVVLNGKPGTAMAPFKHLSDVEIASVVTYTRTAWQNKTTDPTTPQEVKALRK